MNTKMGICILIVSLIAFADTGLKGVTWRLVELNHSAANIQGYWFKCTDDTSATAHMHCNECFYRYAIEDQSVTFVGSGCTVRECFETNREGDFETVMRRVNRWSVSGFQLFFMDSTDTLMVFADANSSNLTGQPWFLYQIRQTSGRTAVPNPINYGVNFKYDGVINAKADCNTCGGVYSDNPVTSQLSISPLSCTEMACGPDSKGGLFAGILGMVDRYSRASDTLYCYAASDTLVFISLSLTIKPNNWQGSEQSAELGISIIKKDRMITASLKGGTIAHARLLDIRGRLVREYEKISDDQAVFCTTKIHAGAYLIQLFTWSGTTVNRRVFIP
jgi:heat shock protein HslJ